MSQQGIRQQWLRDATGATSGTYNENLMQAAQDLAAAPADRTCNEQEIILLQYLLGSSNTDLSGLRAEMAAATGASHWSAVGDLVGGNAAPEFGKVKVSGSLTASITLALPLHAVGSYLTAFIGADTGGSVIASPPAGWVPINSVQAGSGTFNTKAFAFGKVASASEPDPVFTLSVAPYRSIVGAVCSTRNVTGVNTSATSFNTSTTGTDFITNGVTTTADLGIVYVFCINRKGYDPMTAPITGVILDADVSFDGGSVTSESSIYLGYYMKPTAGATGTTTITFGPSGRYRPTAIAVALV